MFVFLISFMLRHLFKISSLFSKSFCVTVQIWYLNLCAEWLLGTQSSKTFQIHKFLKTSSWVFSLGKIFHFLLILVEQNLCYNFWCLDIQMYLWCRSHFWKIIFSNTALIPEYRSETLNMQKGVSLCFKGGVAIFWEELLLWERKEAGFPRMELAWLSFQQWNCYSLR